MPLVSTRMDSKRSDTPSIALPMQFASSRPRRDLRRTACRVVDRRGCSCESDHRARHRQRFPGGVRGQHSDACLGVVPATRGRSAHPGGSISSTSGSSQSDHGARSGTVGQRLIAVSNRWAPPSRSRSQRVTALAMPGWSPVSPRRGPRIDSRRADRLCGGLHRRPDHPLQPQGPSIIRREDASDAIIAEMLDLSREDGAATTAEQVDMVQPAASRIWRVCVNISTAPPW